MDDTQPMAYAKSGSQLLLNDTPALVRFLVDWSANPDHPEVSSWLGRKLNITYYRFEGNNYRDAEMRIIGLYRSKFFSSGNTVKEVGCAIVDIPGFPIIEKARISMLPMLSIMLILPPTDYNAYPRVLREYVDYIFKKSTTHMLTREITATLVRHEFESVG